MIKNPLQEQDHMDKASVLRSASDDDYYLSDYTNSEVGSNSRYLKIGYAAYEVIIVELSTLIRDLHMTALTLELCCILISDRSFDALLVSLLSTAKSSHQSAGIAKQALFSIAQCVVVLCLAMEDDNCSSTREEDRLEWQNRLRKLQNIMLGGSSHPLST
ncbi:hypothetical protein Tco_1133275, partial [Tanacetum coccineum]